jgi:hypothetical protein
MLEVADFRPWTVSSRNLGGVLQSTLGCCPWVAGSEGSGEFGMTRVRL